MHFSVIKNVNFFPCHQTKHPEKFNCLFCYCPLYALGDKCGGNFQFTRDGIKDQVIVRFRIIRIIMDI